MKLEYLKDVDTIDELKKLYRKLAKKLHPDAGGSNEAFVQLQNEFDYFSKILQSGKKDSKNEYLKEFANIINNISHLDLDIEICGSWIWVHGVGYKEKEVHEVLKSHGFLYSRGKKSWYWKPADGMKRKPRTNTDMEEIRIKYGSQRVKGKRKSYKKLASKSN